MRSLDFHTISVLLKCWRAGPTTSLSWGHMFACVITHAFTPPLPVADSMKGRVQKKDKHKMELLLGVGLTGVHSC